MSRVMTASDFHCTEAESKLFCSAWGSFPCVVISFVLSFNGFPFPVDIYVVLNPGSNLTLILIDLCNLTKMTYNLSVPYFLLDCHSEVDC
jgi:hypothetical protein